MERWEAEVEEEKRGKKRVEVEVEVERRRKQSKEKKRAKAAVEKSIRGRRKLEVCAFLFYFPLAGRRDTETKHPLVRCDDVECAQRRKESVVSVK